MALSRPAPCADRPNWCNEPTTSSWCGATPTASRRPPHSACAHDGTVRSSNPATTPSCLPRPMPLHPEVCPSSASSSWSPARRARASTMRASNAVIRHARSGTGQIGLRTSSPSDAVAKTYTPTTGCAKAARRRHQSPAVRARRSGRSGRPQRPQGRRRTSVKRAAKAPFPFEPRDS
jgi:hypothetical protein